VTKAWCGALMPLDDGWHGQNLPAAATSLDALGPPGTAVATGTIVVGDGPVSTKTQGRFDIPLYTTAESARFLGVPTSTFATWAKGYVRRPAGRSSVIGMPIVTSISAEPGYPTVPFVGLAEAMILAAFRRGGVSLQHIRRAVAIIRGELGLDHALASKRLYTDGAVILYDYAETKQDHELGGLTEVVSRQRVFAPVVEEYLKRIEYGRDGWAARLISPATRQPLVVVDPERSFGQPIFIHGAVRVEDVLDRWRAGEPLSDVAEDFGVPAEDVEDILRVALPAAA
jgi:uncharacterized protein (DUF433 family)